MDLDDALESGDEAAIEAALNEMEVSDEMLFGNDDSDSSEAEILPVENTDLEKVETPVEVKDEKPAVEAESEPSPAEDKELKTNVLEQDGKLYVEVNSENAELTSKNGKHKLPYDVLQGAREKLKVEAEARQAAESRSTDIEQQLSEQKQLNEMFTTQLKESGLDPKKTPEQLLQDPEAMAQLAEDNPQLGELIQFLGSKVLNQNENTQEQAPVDNNQSTEGQDPLHIALNETAHLKDWMNNDTDRWEFAQQVDDRLADDTSFKDKPISERFAEVERRVKAAFGDEVEQTETPEVEEPEQPATPIPNSPTDLGRPTSELSKTDQLLDKSAAEMTATMENMSDADIEAALADVSDFL